MIRGVTARGPHCLGSREPGAIGVAGSEVTGSEVTGSGVAECPRGGAEGRAASERRGQEAVVAGFRNPATTEEANPLTAPSRPLYGRGPCPLRNGSLSRRRVRQLRS